MTTFKTATICAAGALALMACGGNDPVAEQANEGAPAAGRALANEAAAAEIRNSALSVGPDETPIPAALHGRWGLTPRACEAPPGRAEGLLVVTGEELLLHESRAEPATSVEASAESISGEFIFTGEAQTERRFQSLQLQGDRLVRAGNGPAASFTYVRCSPEPR